MTNQEKALAVIGVFKLAPEAERQRARLFEAYGDGGESPLAVRADIPVKLNCQLSEALINGAKTDIVVTPLGYFSMVGEIDGILRELGVTAAEYIALPAKRRDDILKKIERKLRARQPAAHRFDMLEQEHAGHERNDLHEGMLTVWSRGVLTLEKPQASSLHHLVNYERAAGDAKSFLSDVSRMQNMIVEHEWAKALPPSTRGEWRLPFEECCWEFRISGVRVLVFTFAADVENPTMVMVYGAQHIWCADDYVYHLGGDALVGRPNDALRAYATREFRRVAELCWANIRAACIMLEAPNVCEHLEREPSAELVAKARRERREPPRKYMVIRLMGMERRMAHYRGAGRGTKGVKMGGHWRRGTWVRYDDPDSGQVQYVNDGGFIVSKTWRSWHFAGDPERMVDREYRL